MGAYRGLKGDGYIVIPAGNYELIEYTDERDAQRQASLVAHESGCAIIYSPVAVVRPKERLDVDFDLPELLDKKKSLLSRMLDSVKDVTPNTPQEPKPKAPSDGE